MLYVCFCDFKNGLLKPVWDNKWYAFLLSNSAFYNACFYELTWLRVFCLQYSRLNRSLTDSVQYVALVANIADAVSISSCSFTVVVWYLWSSNLNAFSYHCLRTLLFVFDFSLLRLYVRLGDYALYSYELVCYMSCAYSSSSSGYVTSLWYYQLRQVVERLWCSWLLWINGVIAVAITIFTLWNNCLNAYLYRNWFQSYTWYQHQTSCSLSRN